MRISIVSGEAEGPTKLNAFDNALTDAGIGDVNLIKVSSMLEKNTEVEDLPKLKPGSMVNCVLSEITSSNEGDEIVACVAIAIGDKLGCAVENSAINSSKDTIEKETIEMLKYMMNKRNVPINDLIVESKSHTVKNIGSVVASVVYLSDDIILE